MRLQWLSAGFQTRYGAKLLTIPFGRIGFILTPLHAPALVERFAKNTLTSPHASVLPPARMRGFGTPLCVAAFMHVAPVLCQIGTVRMPCVRCAY